MSGLTDVQQVVLDLTSAVSDTTTEMAALVAIIVDPNSEDAAVETAAQALKVQVDALNAANAAAKAAIPPKS